MNKNNVIAIAKSVGAIAIGATITAASIPALKKFLKIDKKVEPETIPSEDITDEEVTDED